MSSAMVDEATEEAKPDSKQDRVRPRYVVLGFAVLVLVVLEAWMFVHLPKIYWDTTPTGAVWLWIAVAAAISIALVALFGRLARPVLGFVFVLACALTLPYALAITAQLPHNWVPEYRAELNAMQLPSIVYVEGSEFSRVRCNRGIDSTQHATVSRVY